MKVVLVIGLPASGKSTWAQGQMEALARSGRKCLLLDDPRHKDDLFTILDQAEELQVDYLFIVDPKLCRPSILASARGVLEAQSLVVTEVFFANNPNQCRLNAKRRGLDEKQVLNAIEDWSQEYTPPSACLPVYRDI